MKRMERLDMMVNTIGDYCAQHNLEYVFAVADKKGRVKFSHNISNNIVLKESISIIGKLLGTNEK